VTTADTGANGGAVAAVDCGTNSTRLLVAGPDGRTIDRQMHVTRLGEGVDTARKLSADAIERTLSVLRDYRASMDRAGVVRARMVATSAARDAQNAEEFLSAAQETVGVVPELLSGDQEGKISFRGATAELAGLAQEKGTTELVVDIGGGSTELVAGVPGGPDSSIRVLSLDIGCVRVTERFLSSDPPTANEVETARQAVGSVLTDARDNLGDVGRGSRVIGLAGTVSTLGSLSLGLEHYERDKVHHAQLSYSDVDDWLATLASEPSSARAERPGMEPGRADVIVAGALILSLVMSIFDRNICLVSESDILDGMVLSLLS
jgi:exopolyphosphatase / guanosine-5'-triphosphate,3'-diphosphate pyrophosphatase